MSSKATEYKMGTDRYVMQSHPGERPLLNWSECGSAECFRRNRHGGAVEIRGASEQATGNLVTMDEK